MSIHTIDKANLVNELQCGQSFGQAVHESRRADFKLLLAMLSQDVRDNTPTESISQLEDESPLNLQYQVPATQQLKSNQDSYSRGEIISEKFHSEGLSAAKLQSYLAPDALCYQPEETHNLPEEVYHNLSGHQRRNLEPSSQTRAPLNYQLYRYLVIDQRKSEILAQL
jgi:hypothetical protein